MSQLLTVVPPESPTFAATDHDILLATICSEAMKNGLAAQGLVIDPLRFSSPLFSIICWYIVMQRDSHHANTCH